MKYLDRARLEAIEPAAFLAQKPYPWINPEALLREEGYRALLETLPGLELFDRKFGVERAHGQQSHDRFALEYDPALELRSPWHEFVAELGSPVYRDFLARLFGTGRLRLDYHWHYTPSGCSVSPHCDAKHKLGSHIFYFNTDDDWDPTWGGETLILDDGGRFPRNSAPRFEDFERVTAAQGLGNRSLLFRRGATSWHGVREIRCPADRLRKVFIVVIQRVGWRERWFPRLRRRR